MTTGRSRFNSFPVGEDDVGRRLDRVVRKFLPDHGLGRIFGAIRRGDIQVNSKRVGGDYRLQAGDTIGIVASLRSVRTVVVASSIRSIRLPAWFPGSILFENDNILAIDKPAGILVHGADSLETLVRAYLAPALKSSLSFRPGPLHRLDRNTSGVLLFGKSRVGAARFTALLKSRSVRKGYLVLLEGRLSRAEIWTDRLLRDRGTRSTVASRTGRDVQCEVSPLLSDGIVTLARVIMAGGFTHQIRAQASLNHHPLSGDAKYGGSPKANGYLLHAESMELGGPDSVLGFRKIDSPLPGAQRRRLEALFGRGRLKTALGES